MNKLQKKLEYSAIGSTLSLINIFLINTPYTIVGLFFGFLAVGFFLKALSIKND